jgi:hypothetical protein
MELSGMQAQWEVLGLFALWGSRPLNANHRVLGYSFPPLSGESGILMALWQWGVSTMVVHSVECWDFMCHRKQVSWHLQSCRLPLSGRAGFLLFDRAAGALLQEGVVGSTGPSCSVLREASLHPQSSKVWNLRFTCPCGGMQLALCSKLRMPRGQQSWQAWTFWNPLGIKGPEVYLCWGMGFQEPQKLLQAWENVSCQWEFCFQVWASSSTVE